MKNICTSATSAKLAVNQPFTGGRYVADAADIEDFPTSQQHYQYVPGEEHIVVWSPQYHNPYYHNDGNPDSLMPTITEYYTPKYEGRDFVDMKETIRQKQKGAYATMMEKNDVRIVFMKNLVDTSFVFLGVYRFSPTLSDTTKIVWIRATDKCDLDNISFLNNYRN